MTPLEIKQEYINQNTIRSNVIVHQNFDPTNIKKLYLPYEQYKPSVIKKESDELLYLVIIATVIILIV